MRKIFWKVFFGSLFITLLFALLLLLFFVPSLKRSAVASEARLLRSMSEALTPLVVAKFQEGDQGSLSSLLKSVAQRGRVRITLLSPQGQVLADSSSFKGPWEIHLDRQEVGEALKNREGRSLRMSTTLKEKMLYVAERIEEGGRVLAVLRLSLSLKEVERLTAELERKIFLFSLLALLFVFGASWLFARSLSKPLEDLREAAERVAQGDYSTRLHPRSRDEVSLVAESFNSMTEGINALLGEVREERDRRETILRSLPQALGVVSERGEVLLANRAMERAAGGPLVGEVLTERFRMAGMDELLTKSRKLGEATTGELGGGGRIFSFSAVPLSGGRETVVILEEITEKKNLEKVKKELVVNVSHELRTPLTAIKGFVETLEEEVEDSAAQGHLGIIRRNVDRLVRIVEDLLLLSQLEDPREKLLLEPIDLRELLNNVSLLFTLKAKEKGLAYGLELPQEPLVLKADAFKLEQLFINLVDNAIKYTDHGGIVVRARKDRGRLVAEVEDSGLGIPPEHQPRIFDRFHVVDPSRSRRQGGTGLGLSLVKHIALLHGAEVEVKSEQGKGSLFRVLFSKEKKS